MKDMLDRSLSPKQKGSVSGRLLSFIAAGLAMLVVGGFALGVRGVNKRITQHRADVPTAPEKLRVQKVADVSERGLAEVLAGGRMKNGEAVSIKGRLFPFNDPKTGDAAFMPLSAYDADNNSMEVARSDDQNEWGVDSRLRQDENGDLTILEQTASYISAMRKTVETKKGVRSTRYFMIGDHVVYSWDEAAIYSPDDIKKMKAKMNGLTGNLANVANRAAFDAKYPDDDSRRAWLERQIAGEVTLKDGKFTFTRGSISDLLANPKSLIPSKGEISRRSAKVVGKGKAEPSDIIEIKGANAAGSLFMKFTDLSEKSALVEGQEAPLVMDIKQHLPGDTTHLDPVLHMAIYPDAFTMFCSWTTPAGDEVTFMMSQGADEKTEGASLLWTRDADHHVEIKLPVLFSNDQVRRLVRSLNASAQAFKELSTSADGLDVSRKDVGQKPKSGAESKAQP